MQINVPSSPLSMSRSVRAAKEARLLMLGLLWPLVFACDAPDVATDDALENRARWSDEDRPSLLGESFTYDFERLPTRGKVEKMPWPGSYWPTYVDSINYRWAGPESRSPAEKYELAFGKSGIEDAVSREWGIDSLDAPRCDKDSDCAEGSKCGRRRGEEQGRCAAEWYGVCDGWAAAALLEDEPQKAIEFNGVRFEIADLKALLAFTYSDGLTVRRVSLRCNYAGSEYDLADVEACKDTNAGTFHVAVTNMIGLRGESFIMDHTYDEGVWNHPIIRYEITRNKQISPSAANELLDAEGQRYAFNDDAAELRRMRMAVYWLSTTTPEAGGTLADEVEAYTYKYVYDYILELDDRGRVIGGEWLGESRAQHPDFLWLPVEKHDSSLAGIDYCDLKKLLLFADDA